MSATYEFRIDEVPCALVPMAHNYVWRVVHRDGTVVLESKPFRLLIEAKDNFRLVSALLSTPGAIKIRSA